MSDADQFIRTVLDSVFDPSIPEGEVRHIIAPTEIGPVMFGTDRTMKYGDNFSEEVPDDLREVALKGLYNPPSEP